MGGGARNGSASLRVAEVEEQTHQGLGVLDLGQMRCDLADRPVHELELFVVLGVRRARFETLGDEQVHALATEARGRVEHRRLTPGAARQAGLLLELAPGARERGLTVRQRARRQFDELPPRRFPTLAHQSEDALSIDCDDCDCPWMLDDLALVIAPALERDAEELSVVDESSGIGLHPANRSTRARCSLSNHGGDPAAAFSRTCSGSRVAGMTTSTRGSDNTHFNNACGHVCTPSSSRISAGGVLRASEPSPSGRITSTPT